MPQPSLRYCYATNTTNEACWSAWMATSMVNTTTMTDGAWTTWTTTGQSWYYMPPTSTYTNAVWSMWAKTDLSSGQAVSIGVHVEPAVLSPEELERRAKEAEARRLEAEARAVTEKARRLEAERQAAAAESRAKELLLENLNLEQRLQYEKEKRFRVRTPAVTLYELRHGWAGNVEELDEKEKPIRRFCIHPRESVPVADSLLAQKLMLETDEPRFRKTANIMALRTGVGVAN